MDSRVLLLAVALISALLPQHGLASVADNKIPAKQSACNLQLKESAKPSCIYIWSSSYLYLSFPQHSDSVIYTTNCVSILKQQHSVFCFTCYKIHLFVMWAEFRYIYFLGARNKRENFKISLQHKESSDHLCRRWIFCLAVEKAIRIDISLLTTQFIRTFVSFIYLINWCC